MIYILSLTTRKALKNTFQATTFKVEENSRTFQGLAQKFNDFSRKNGIQELFKTLQTLDIPTPTTHEQFELFSNQAQK